MELRIFFPKDVGFNLQERLKELGVRHSVSPLEERTDHYLDLKDANFGLKMRGNNKLELKVRRKKEGVVTYWEKVVAVNCNGRRDAILNALRRHRPTQERFENFLQIDTYEFRKKRVQFETQEFSCEQVSICVYKGEEFLGEFESVNFEGADVTTLLAANSKIMGGLLKNERLKMMDYPEFIMHLRPS
eukprot:TRINITY_DN9829_c0_g1_i1.p1 TRINITY_DN9829_c0_g1~~TRINITY_DN9829_c0_g1_i1.p1  ORF type:complete len:188 (-),score=26.85 TRINITY_DN9829_c0_g1_i1:115-678(-)